MKNIVIIEKLDEYSEVYFYSVKVETEEYDEPELNEFEKFIEKFQNIEDETIKEEYNDILAIIKHIGKHSADMKYFRAEGPAFALPPSARTKIKEVTIQAYSKLRLYCILVSESNVILCNGGVKTTDRAQDCPNVKPHFEFARKLANKINKERSSLNISFKKMDIGEENAFYF